MLPFTDPDRRQEVRRTLVNIAVGGPFPYPQDGMVFRNRGGLLPPKSLGYYQEYTVVTIGVTNRGKRRIVQGQGGETYYTDDHYTSFVQIDPMRV